MYFCFYPYPSVFLCPVTYVCLSISPYDSRTPITSWESKASPSLSAWTSFMALSCRRLLMLEKIDSFHVSSISWRKKAGAVVNVDQAHNRCYIKSPFPASKNSRVHFYSWGASTETSSICLLNHSLTHKSLLHTTLPDTFISRMKYHMTHTSISSLTGRFRSLLALGCSLHPTCTTDHIDICFPTCQPLLTTSLFLLPFPAALLCFLSCLLTVLWRLMISGHSHMI